MKKDITKVIFRTINVEGIKEIIALFPELPGTNDVTTCLNYTHVGQHGSSSAKLIGKAAMPFEYGELAKELERIGYNLRIVTRISYEMDQKRSAELRRSRQTTVTSSLL